MFMCKKEFLKKYYESIFPWLEKCENLFGFDLEGYGMKRIYGFLAERYLSYWFSKYCRVKEVPILFKDETISSLKSIKTFSTILIIFSSVILNPLKNFDSMLDLSNSLFILGPPP